MCDLLRNGYKKGVGRWILPTVPELTGWNFWFL
jgi:hypothetical protein